MRIRAAAVAAAISIALPVSSAFAVAPEERGIVAAGNGTAGVRQTIDVVAPQLRGGSIPVTASLNGAGTVVTVELDEEGRGSATWTPTASGTWTLGAAGDGLRLAFSKPVIAAVPTVTEVLIPDKAERFVPMGLIASVRSAEGTAKVTGTVTFYEANLGRLGTVDVTTLPGERALANLTWTPPVQGAYAFSATFTPARNPQSGTAAVQASQSGTSYLTVTEHPVPVQLLMPPVMRIGHPVPVIAQLPTIYRGTVSLVVDDRQVSPDKQTEGGLAAFEWTPTHVGLTYVQLQLEGGVAHRLDHLVTQTVDVQPEQVPNPISVTPVVNGVAGRPWANGAVLKYPGGTRIDLVTSTGNGAGVNIEQQGPCLITGATLFVPVAGGGCRVRFTAPGDARFARNGAELLITSSAQPSARRGPASS